MGITLLAIACVVSGSDRSYAYYVNPNPSAVNVTTTTLSVSTTSASYGTSITFTGTVTGQQSCPCGPLTIVVDGVDTATTGSIATNDSATVSTTISNLSVGSHTVYAEFRPTGVNIASHSSEAGITISKASTSTSLSSPSSVDAGGTATFTATVTPSTSGGSLPSGSVTFYDGGTQIGTATLSGGTATFSTSSLAAGSHSISASYAGNTNYTGSTSSPKALTVKSSTTTSVSASPSSGVYGTTVTFTATISSASGTPTGTVTFYDGATSLGSSALSSGTATLSTSSLSIASHTITATYAGNADYMTSSGTTNATINKIGTTISVASSSASAVYGSAVTFTATVTPDSGSGTPTGTVTFYDGATSLGSSALSSGTATLSTSSLSIASHTITATYAGDGTYLSGSGTTTVSVVPPDPVISSLSPSSGPAVGGTTVTIKGTYLSNVTSVTFGGVAGTKITIGSDSQLTVVTPAHAAGTVDVVITSTSGSTTVSGGFSYAHKDPSQDVTIQRMIYHEVQAMVDFGQGQMDSVQDRMAMLNACSPGANGTDGDGDSSCMLPSFTQGILVSAPSSAKSSSRNALTEDPAATSGGSPEAGAETTEAPDSQRAKELAGLPSKPHFWTAGQLTYGRDGGTKGGYSFTMTGLSLGGDMQVTKTVSLGLAVGFGHDTATIDDNGSRLSTDVVSGQVYGTYRVLPRTFVNMAAGYGGGRIAANRYDSEADAIATGTRSASDAFATVSVNHSMVYEGLMFVPYLRADVQHVWLGSYSETGAGMNNLSYDQLQTTVTSGTVGNRFSYVGVETPLGYLIPALNVRYRRMLSGDYAQNLFYDDSPSTVYTLNGSVPGRDQGIVGVSFSLQPRRGIVVNLGYDAMFSKDTRSQGIKAHLAVQF